MSGGGSNTIFKHLSTFFFGCNYAGIIYGALTLPGSSSNSTTVEDDKRKVKTYIFKLLLLVVFDHSCQARYFHGEQLPHPFAEIRPFASQEA